MKVVPLTLREANAFVEKYHRHNKPCRGHRFSLGLMEGAQLVGVAICGRPISRMMCDGLTLEVNRLCVSPEAPKNSCSFFYRCCWRVWSAMGGHRMITYTLQSESGSSLRGAGFRLAKEIKGAGWNRFHRERELQDVQMQDKFRWELSL